MYGWFFHCFSWPHSFFFSSGEAFDCGRYISSLPCTSTSRWGHVSPVIDFNKCEVSHDTIYSVYRINDSRDIFYFSFPGQQTFMSVWMKVSVSSPVRSPLPLWAVWVQYNVLAFSFKALKLYSFGCIPTVKNKPNRLALTIDNKLVKTTQTMYYKLKMMSNWWMQSI